MSPNRIDEFEMYLHRRGPLFDWLKNQRDMSDCGTGTPVATGRAAAACWANFLAIHANYLDAARHCRAGPSARPAWSIVPRSHAYFRPPALSLPRTGRRRRQRLPGHRQPGQRQDHAAGPKPELNMFAEMRAFALSQPDVAPAEVLRMATQAGAQRLGCQGRVGGLFPHALADLIALPFAGKTEDAPAGVVHHTGELSAAMIDGQWICPPRSA